MPPEHVPALCRAVSIATGAETRPDDREAGARSTVRRWLADQPATGYAQLAAKWPAVAMAIDDATAMGADAQMRALAAAPAPGMTRSLEETTVALEEVIRTAPPGVTLISAECGLGKTKAAIKVAAARAAKPYASPDTKGERAPPQSKTSISVDKNELAKQIQDAPELAGVGVKRIFGPLSVLRDDATPECRYHEIAQPLVAGGQSMQRELCEGRGRFQCRFYTECMARRGCEGPDNARITIGPHALISSLDKSAGATGLLVIDEPPYLLDVTSITQGDLSLTESLLSAFDRDYADAMRPALFAIRSWLERPDMLPDAMTVKDAVRALSHTIAPICLDRAQMAAEIDGDAVECAACAPLLDSRTAAPPLRLVELAKAQHSVERARKLGKASAVLGCLYHALSTSWRVIGRVEERVGQAVLLITSARRDLTETLRRDGAVVVMDANIEMNVPIYQKALGYEPLMHDFRAVDGAPIERTHLWCSSASRTQWLRSGKLVPKPSLVNAIRAIFEWVREKPADRKLGLITLKPVRLALDVILHSEDVAAAEAWKKAGQLEGTLVELRRSLDPIISTWDGEVILGHYGAVRGLDTMADVDCLATLGDPWPNIGHVRRDMDYLGMPEARDARNEALCRAELEQAHGRLRTIHRPRPGRALHVGRVLPGGSGWCGGKVRRERMKTGRPKSTTAMTIEELVSKIIECGGLKASARKAGCSAAYLRQCRDGNRPISQKIANVLRSPATGQQGGRKSPFNSK